MKSRYDDAAAPTEVLQLRAYTSRLLGAEPSLVLHGGGNTSVKHTAQDFFGEPVELLYVKGSGWDLASIEPAGFAPVRLDVLRKMARLSALADSVMVREQRAAMLEPSAPNPSVEAILHAVLPPAWVDHTHADAVVTLTNTPGGEARVRELYGERVLYVPYVMPGFVLARAVYELVRERDLSKLEGMILSNHGVFTWGDDARTSYERMIRLVSEAEDALAGPRRARPLAPHRVAPDPLALASLRAAVSRAAGRAMIARFDGSPEAAGFAAREDAPAIATRGPVTPDHVIRTKAVPLVAGTDASADVAAYADAYRAYFARNDDGSRTMLDPAPRWALWPARGLVAFGASAKAAGEVADIARHTIACISDAEALGGWAPLGERDLFDMEYWTLEQAKLRTGGAPPPLAGKIAFVTGAASGIGRAIARELGRQGAAVCGADVRPSITEDFTGPGRLGVVCDVTDAAAVDAAVRACVEAFGGLDLLVCNAGDFPPSAPIEAIEEAAWARALELNLGGVMRAMRAAIPFLERGLDPSILVIASRNVPAPGPGAAAYSASKAAATQLARVAALELAPRGVRVNLLHPDKVFDTDLWTEEKLRLRAEHYGLSVEAYKRSNLLGVEVTTDDVARIAAAVLGPTFRTVTGAQIPVDGGNDRVV
ncbi:MAG: bifunctional aldolase/short-chain dehydrogenase [Sandaracinaceae bacterium]|nr:bifunctional aldolase/short-chain dehydrogenase [Sandaracinaceae bacterium]